ncbi:hypothetical protein ACFWFI_08365 [Streptomyces sp. NPDC060209]|uniref:hypothetical protein n=1 Tax=Streptomyces sp. NPDC060209 TaxID=3347073 RepID=UPI0036632625
MRSRQPVTSRVLVTSASAVCALALATAPGHAAAATSWNATGTVADVVGAHAWGTISAGPSAGTYTVTANIKDTKADSHGARVNLRAACDGSCVTLVSVSASGLDEVRTGSFTLRAPITVQECLTEAGVDYICAEPYTIS